MSIEPNMRRKLDYSAQRVAKSIRERDHLIREAIDAGASYREVAEHAGVSHMTVKRIAAARDGKES